MREPRHDREGRMLWKPADFCVLVVGGILLASAPSHQAMADDEMAADNMVTAINRMLPAEVLAASGLSAEEIAAGLRAAGNGWRPVESAPRDREVLLGRRTDSGFRYGVGYWEVADDLHAGRWTVEEWWGEAPTHWLSVPPVPAR